MAGQLILFLASVLLSARLSQGQLGCTGVTGTPATSAVHTCFTPNLNTCCKVTSFSDMNNYRSAHAAASTWPNPIWECCLKATHSSQTVTCSNSYANHQCPLASSYCCPSMNSYAGVEGSHSGCCTTSPKTICSAGTATAQCHGTVTSCCSGQCCTPSSSCKESGGRSIVSRGNNSLLLSVVGIATVVIIISMAIIPLPMVMFTKTK